MAFLFQWMSLYVSNVYFPTVLLTDAQNCGFRMRRECRERFPRHRWLAFPTCITERAWRIINDCIRDIVEPNRQSVSDYEMSL